MHCIMFIFMTYFTPGTLARRPSKCDSQHAAFLEHPSLSPSHGSAWNAKSSGSYLVKSHRD